MVCCFYGAVQNTLRVMNLLFRKPGMAFKRSLRVSTATNHQRQSKVCKLGCRHIYNFVWEKTGMMKRLSIFEEFGCSQKWKARLEM